MARSGSNVFTIKRDRLSDQIARNIEELIVSGQIRIGEALPSERELMERYGVGRPAVREALLWLDKKGLITVSNGERARVTEPDPQDLLDYFSGAALLLASSPEGMHAFQQTRLFAEVALAREAARTATEADLHELRALVEANQASFGDNPTFIRTDEAFHFGIAQVSRNSLIIALYNSVVAVLQNQRHTSLIHPQAMRAAIDCHTRVYEAIAARDPDRVEAEMRRHLSEVEDFYWAVRKEDGQAKAGHQEASQSKAGQTKARPMKARPTNAKGARQP